MSQRVALSHSEGLFVDITWLISVINTDSFVLLAMKDNSVLTQRFRKSVNRISFFYAGSDDVVCKHLKMKMKTELLNWNVSLHHVVINYANKRGEWKWNYFFIPRHYSDTSGIMSALVETAEVRICKTCFVYLITIRNIIQTVLFSWLKQLLPHRLA